MLEGLAAAGGPHRPLSGGLCPSGLVFGESEGEPTTAYLLSVGQHRAGKQGAGSGIVCAVALCSTRRKSETALGLPLGSEGEK